MDEIPLPLDVKPFCICPYFPAVLMMVPAKISTMGGQRMTLVRYFSPCVRKACAFFKEVNGQPLCVASGTPVDLPADVSPAKPVA